MSQLNDDRERYPSDTAPSNTGASDPAARDAGDESQVQNTRPERPAAANANGPGMANEPHEGRPMPDSGAPPQSQTDKDARTQKAAGNGGSDGATRGGA